MTLFAMTTGRTDAGAEDAAPQPPMGKAAGDATGRSQDARLSYAGELKRKALHLLALVIPIGMLLLGRQTSIAVLIPLAALAATADVLRSRSKAFADIIRSVVGDMMRPAELHSASGAVVLNGATWVLISAAALAVLFPVDIGAPAFASFMVGDAAAALVGIRFGKHRWFQTDRTLEGSAAFAAAAFLCLLPFGDVSLAAGAVTAVAGAAGEVPSRPLNDNVRAPLIMAIVLLLFATA